MLKKIYMITSMMLLFASLIVAGEKKVLVEVLTNSHCPLCPPAHTTIDSYLQSANADKIEFIYYHMPFPYSSDQLYQHNTVDASTKNSFYGPHSSTPKAYFNGTLVSNSYSSWSNSLDALVTEESNFDITLSGSYSENEIIIFADITHSGTNTVSDLTINYVVVEDVNYSGQNGISNHKNVMRKIVNPQGIPFSIGTSETKNLSTTITKNTAWNTNNLKVIVFVQNSSSKEIFQTASIPYSGFTVTDVEDENILVNNFQLAQNYPNPFNPTTTLNYSIPSNNYVSLNVFDIIGNEVAQLVNENKSAGEHNIVFDASGLANGVYYYQIKAGDFIQTKKMILLK